MTLLLDQAIRELSESFSAKPSTTTTFHITTTC
jgi:hypothetical protein